MVGKQLNKIIVISPHRDDAVISIGDYIFTNFEEVVVLNVFTESISAISNIPKEKEVVPKIRKHEDQEVSRIYGFKFIDGHFPDTSLRGINWFDQSIPVDKTLLNKVSNWIDSKLDKILTKNCILFIPAAYGLHHDHYLCLLSFAENKLLRKMKKIKFRVYCDQPYYFRDKLFHKGHEYLKQHGQFNSHIFNTRSKENMLKIYKSQLTDDRINLLTKVIGTECFWEVDLIFFIQSKQKLIS